MRVVAWVLVAMIFEAVIFLWPLACALSGRGFISIWTAVDQTQVRGILVSLCFGLCFGLVAGSAAGLAHGPFFALFLALVGAPVAGLAGGAAYIPFMRIATGGIPRLVLRFLASLVFGLSSGLLTELLFTPRRRLVRVLAILAPSLFVILFCAVILAPISIGIPIGLGVLVGTFLGTLMIRGMIRGLRHISQEGILTLESFFNPWRLKTYSLGKAVAFFLAVYTVIVLIFSFWFYACYLEGPEFINASRIREFRNVMWWDFVYFSFVTMTTLGYGDISPIHPFPQFVVVLETMFGAAGFVGNIIVLVSGQLRRRIT